MAARNKGLFDKEDKSVKTESTQRKTGESFGLSLVEDFYKTLEQKADKMFINEIELCEEILKNIKQRKILEAQIENDIQENGMKRANNTRQRALVKKDEEWDKIKTIGNFIDNATGEELERFLNRLIKNMDEKSSRDGVLSWQIRRNKFINALKMHHKKVYKKRKNREDLTGADGVDSKKSKNSEKIFISR